MTYTDEQLLSRIKGLDSFRDVPELLFVAVRSKADAPDKFDDKFYFFQNGKFRLVATCTTNPGLKSLKGGWRSTNKLGSAIIKSDEIYYNVYQKSDGKRIRHHKDKMPCFRQVGSLKYFRDNNNDEKSDEIGRVYEGNNSTNIHASTYDENSKAVTAKIGGWSEGCIVLNNRKIYNTLYDIVPFDKEISLALLKEF